MRPENNFRPLVFEASFEEVPDDEEETTRELLDTLLTIQQTTYANTNLPLRSVHAKSHGLLRGELKVLDGLPTQLAHGLFARVATYPVAIRLSTNPGDLLDDHVSTPRGLALKVSDVEGERLLGDAHQSCQDFVLVNAKSFNSPDPKAFLRSLKLLAKTTDKAPGLKKALSAVLRGVESTLESVGVESPTLKSLGGHPLTNILGESYSSLVPILYGPYYAKLQVVPISPELTKLTNEPVDLEGNPDGLRESVRKFFSAHDATWEVRVQLATDLKEMPVEDAAAVWPEGRSAFLPVARIHVARQDSWSEENERTIDQGMLFSPWQGLAAHRPLGGIMRVRKRAYEHSAQFRTEHGGCPIRTFKADLER